jgi:hypothetical protein
MARIRSLVLHDHRFRDIVQDQCDYLRQRFALELEHCQLDFPALDSPYTTQMYLKVDRDLVTTPTKSPKPPVSHSPRVNRVLRFDSPLERELKSPSISFSMSNSDDSDDSLPRTSMHKAQLMDIDDDDKILGDIYIALFVLG